MNKTLLLATALVAITGAGTSVHAQSVKGGQDVMKDTQRFEPAPVMPKKEAPAPVYQQETVAVQTTTDDTSNRFNGFSGIYGGGDVGYAVENDTEGFNGGVFAGYGFEHGFNWLGTYAGAELGYNYSDADGSTGGNSFDKDHDFTATFRPGIGLYETAMLYGIVGYSRAEFESNGDDEYLDGLILGGGLQLDTNTPFKPRVEYTYTNYEDETIGGNNFNINENNIKVGAVFQF